MPVVDQKFVEDFQVTLDKLELEYKKPKVDVNILGIDGLKETLRQLQEFQKILLENFRQIVEAVRDIRIDAPVIPEVRVPAPQVTVNVPKVEVPKAFVEVTLPKEMDIKKPSWLRFTEFGDVKIILKDIARALFSFRFPAEANEAIPVRLSDGKNFIEALTKVISGGGGAVVRHPFQKPSGTAPAELTEDGYLRVQVENPTADPETGLATSAKQDILLTELQLKANLSETQPVSVVAPTGINGAPVAVGVVAVEMTFTGATRVIALKAASTNTGLIWLGPSTIDNTGANAYGELTADSAVEIELNDTSAAIYCVSDTAGQTVYKMALT